VSRTPQGSDGDRETYHHDQNHTEDNMTKELRFGDLILCYTNTYQLRYNDKGSGAEQDGAFWHPVPPAGFSALGSIGVSGYEDINATKSQVSLCVKPASGCESAIKPPTGYTRIWTDKGSGADMDGSCWRPIPPEGYVALGDVFVNGYGQPALTDIVCIKKELAQDAKVGSSIWNDRKSGADEDIATYGIDTPKSYVDAEKGVFAPHTFVAANSYDRKPDDATVLYCLNLPIPYDETVDPPAPTLTSYKTPPEFTGTTIDRVVHVPFTAVTDDSRSVQWKFDNSPFYTIEREIAYELELFDNNQTSESQEVSKTVTTGVSKSSSETFSQKTGISIAAESGVSFLGTGGKVTATISV
jgi:hypothetical protein